MGDRPGLVVLDVEGVLLPEVWIAVAERTGVEGLRRTTRDEPDYERLMRARLELLDRHGLTMSAIEDVIGGLSPLPGAAEFLHDLRTRTQVVLLSDTFAEFARPLMAQLDWPTILCHSLEIVDDRIVGYRLRLADQKRRAVEAFQGLGYEVVAAGDSYNDVSMLRAADTGLLFHAPPNVRADHPDLPAYDTYPALTAALHAALDSR